MKILREILYALTIVALVVLTAWAWNVPAHLPIWRTFAAALFYGITLAVCANHNKKKGTP